MTVERDHHGFDAPAPLGHPARAGLPDGHSTGPEIGERLPDFKLPDAHGRAPSSISAMLSGIVIQSAFYALLKVCLPDYILWMQDLSPIINFEPFAELLPWIDAINMDIKSIRPEFYERLCGGTLEPVLRNATIAARRTHLEVTNLIIPGHNDSDEELEELATWIARELGPQVPTHLSAYFPRYKLQAPPTPVETPERAHAIFSRHLRYVYLGNVYSGLGADTPCAQCGAILVARRGYSVRIVGLDERGKCRKCGAENNFVV